MDRDRWFTVVVTFQAVIMSEFLDNSFPVPVPVDQAHNYDPALAPLEPETTVLPVDLNAAVSAGMERIKDVWQQNQVPAGRSAIWPWIVAGIAIGLFINRK